MKPCSIEQLKDELNASDDLYGPDYYIVTNLHKHNPPTFQSIHLLLSKEDDIYNFYRIDFEPEKRVFIQGNHNTFLLNLFFKNQPNISTLARKIMKKIRKLQKIEMIF